MEICNINKSKIKNFITSLTLREEDLLEDFDDEDYSFNIGDKEFKVKFVTFTIEGGCFVGGNGQWDDIINKLFKTNKGD